MAGEERSLFAIGVLSFEFFFHIRPTLELDQAAVAAL